MSHWGETIKKIRFSERRLVNIIHLISSLSGLTNICLEKDLIIESIRLNCGQDADCLLTLRYNKEINI